MSSTFCARIWADPLLRGRRVNSFLNFCHVCYDTVHMVGNLCLIIVASDLSETTVNTLHSTQCRNTQDRSLNFHLCQCFQSCAVQLILDLLAHHSISQSLKMHLSKEKLLCVFVLICCWLRRMVYVDGNYAEWCVHDVKYTSDKTASVIFKQGLF